MKKRMTKMVARLFAGMLALECLAMGGAVQVQAKTTKNVTIVLDAGHDGTHVGARANGVLEEVATLKIAQACRDELSTYDGVTVYMTRESAGCLAPGAARNTCNFNRVQIAKNKGADALVSLHLNSSTSAVPSGATVYHPNANYNAAVGAAGQNLSACIQKKLVALGLKNNGIKIRNSETNTKYADGSNADYYDLIKNSKLSGFPGIIVEHAFLSNGADAANFLSSDEKLKRLGIADAEGIAEYYGLQKGAAAGKVYVKDDNLATGTFKVNIGGITKGKTIKFKVYPKGKASAAMTYSASYQDGVYSAGVDVKNHAYTSGTYVIVANQIESSGKETKLDQKEFEFKEPKFEKSVVSVKETTTEMKKFSVYATELEDAKEVYVEVWNNKNPSTTKQKLTMNLKNGSWKATYDTTKYKIGGKYSAQVYVKTCFNTTVKLKTVSFTTPKPKMGTLKLASQNTETGTFTLKIPNVKSDAGIKNVKVVVWSQSDKKDAKTYTAKKDSSGNYIVTGSINNHNQNYGTYKAQATVIGKNEVSLTASTVKFQIKAPQAVVAAKTSSSEKSTMVTATNVTAKGGVANVQFEVKRKSDGEKILFKPKYSSGKWTAKISSANLDKSGEYQVTVYAYGKIGNKKVKVGTAKFTLSAASVGKIEIRNKKDATGKFDVVVSDVKAIGGIKQVQVYVWKKADKSDMFVYNAKADGSSYKANVSIADLEGKAGTYNLKVGVEAKSGVITKDKRTTVVKMKTEIPVGGYQIMGTTSVTVEQMMNYYKKYATYPAFYESTDAPTLKKFCQFYLTECEAEGVRAEVAFTQAMKETNFLRYGGDVKIAQFNFAGLGAVGGGAAGASFSSVKIGIRAQIQHLKAYASTEPLKQACVDGRFDLVKPRGCAAIVEWLGIKENPQKKGWATDPGYGNDIVKRIQILKGCAK